MRARRDIDKGETIRYLCGNLVAMTEEEEKDLDLTRRDFSIVMSSRKKTPSLFLGPARFANHDCNANARLTTVGSDGMQIVAVRKIHQDDEITVTYGEDYFGTDNCECLCSTCEQNGQGGWTPSPDSAELQTPEPSREDSTGPYGFRRKRKYGAISASNSATPDPESFRSKRRRSSTAESSRPSSMGPKPRGRHAAKSKRRSALSRFSPEINENTVADEVGPATESSPAPIVALPEPVLKAEMGVFTSDVGQDPPRVVAQDQEPAEELIHGNNATPKRPACPSGIILQSDEPTTPSKRPRSSQLSAESTDVDSVFDEVDLIPTGTPSSIHSEGQMSRHHLIKAKGTAAPLPNDSPKATATEVSEVLIKQEDLDMPRVVEEEQIQQGKDVNSEASQTMEEKDIHEERKQEFRLMHAVEEGGQWSETMPEVSQTVEEEQGSERNDVGSNASQNAKQEQTQTQTPEPETEEAGKYDSDSDSDSALSTLSSSEEFDDLNLCIIRKKRRGRKKRLAPAAPIPSIAADLAPEIPKVRHPGDYAHTPILLAEPESKWVCCRTCSQAWVQQNAYYTRRECPRCERHSKLYGYRWPKTEQLRGDSERVRDHREVHRFLDRGEEEELRKSVRGKEGMEMEA